MATHPHFSHEGDCTTDTCAVRRVMAQRARPTAYYVICDDAMVYQPSERDAEKLARSINRLADADAEGGCCRGHHMVATVAMDDATFWRTFNYRWPGVADLPSHPDCLLAEFIVGTYCPTHDLFDCWYAH